LKLAVTIAALALSVLTAAPAAAYCQLNLKYENGALQWDRIDGATDYWILEAVGDPIVYRHFTTRGNSFKVAHRSSAGTIVRYTLTATIDRGVRGHDHEDGPHPIETNDACAATIDVEVPADPAFRAMTRRGILPVVGSTAGSMGGKFKTSLVMRPYAANQRGRLVFHPAGQVASDSDPSIPYAFNGAEPLVFDDVVAAIGTGGIGSLDIIPDEDASSKLPTIEARLYNDTPIGTFGTIAHPAYPYDYLRPPVLEVVVPENDRTRINVGLRTITATTARIFIYNAVGTLLHFRDVTFPAGWMQMTSVHDFAGRQLGPGQKIQVHFSGAVIPFHTVTENSTNDPTLIVAQPRPSSKDVGAYVD
jgi:hypothetical protein